MFHQVRTLWARRGIAGLARGARTRRCPSCGSGLPTALPVCPACRYVEKVDESVTHHELFGLPYEPNPFVVDTRQLKRRFLEAQRLCHPDGWGTRSAGDRDAAQAVSNAVNTAYKTLASPMERIGYVLGRNGKEVGEAEQVEDTRLIMEVMEAREAVEGSEGDALGRLREANDGECFVSWSGLALRRAAADKVKEAVVAIEGAVGRGDWVRAKRWAVRLKYLLTIEDAIRARAENAEA